MATDRISISALTNPPTGRPIDQGTVMLYLADVAIPETCNNCTDSTSSTEQAAPRSRFSDLPNEILIQIFVLQTAAKLISLQRTSRRIRDISVFILEKRLQATFGSQPDKCRKDNTTVLFESYAEFQGWVPPSPVFMPAEYLGIWRIDDPNHLHRSVRPPTAPDDEYKWITPPTPKIVATSRAKSSSKDSGLDFNKIDTSDMSQLYCHFTPYKDRTNEEFYPLFQNMLPSPSVVPLILQPTVLGVEPFLIGPSPRTGTQGTRLGTPGKNVHVPMFKMEKANVDPEWLNQAANATMHLIHGQETEWFTINDNRNDKGEVILNEEDVFRKDAQRMLWFGNDKGVGMRCRVDRVHDPSRFSPSFQRKKYPYLMGLKGRRVEYIIYYESLVVNALRFLAAIDRLEDM